MAKKGKTIRKKKTFRKGFRKNKRIKHPTYLIDKDGNLYQYIGITHSEKTNGSDNIPLAHNPNPKDTRKAYIRPLVEEDKASNFGRRLNGWAFTKEDMKTVSKIAGKNKGDKKKKVTFAVPFPAQNAQPI